MKVASKFLQFCPVKRGFELHVVNLRPELRGRMIVPHLSFSSWTFASTEQHRDCLQRKERKEKKQCAEERQNKK